MLLFIEIVCIEERFSKILRQQNYNCQCTLFYYVIHDLGDNGKNIKKSQVLVNGLAIPYLNLFEDITWCTNKRFTILMFTRIMLHVSALWCLLNTIKCQKSQVFCGFFDVDEIFLTNTARFSKWPFIIPTLRLCAIIYRSVECFSQFPRP